MGLVSRFKDWGPNFFFLFFFFFGGGGLKTKMIHVFDYDVYIWVFKSDKIGFKLYDWPCKVTISIHFISIDRSMGTLVTD
jgi:hypothetical protein